MQFLDRLKPLGLLILRARHPGISRPFRMWLYPAPALIAIVAFLYILFSRPDFQREIHYAVVLLIAGVALYFARAFRRKEWPWAS